MSGRDPTEVLSEMLRGLNEILARYFDKLATPVIGSYNERVASFGHYTAGGRSQIDEIAKMVSDLGKTALTLDGYYMPNSPANLHSINDFIPIIVREILYRIGRDNLVIQILPKVVYKAVINFTILRSQLIEWNVLRNHGGHSLSFIICDEITKGLTRDCDYLSVHRTYSECVSPYPMFCSRRLYCPFIQCVNVPSVVREGTIHDRPRSRLIAVRNLQNVRSILKEWLADC